MDNHFELTDLELEEQFASGALDQKLFSHEAHLRLAWIHISNYGIHQAITAIRKQLQDFAERIGKKDKYNETITIASLHAVHHFMRRSKTDTFKDFITENPGLKFNFKELLGFHYRTNIFLSEKAKEGYLEPELLPFD
jgi:hypothetical protein